MNVAFDPSLIRSIPSGTAVVVIPLEKAGSYTVSVFRRILFKQGAYDYPSARMRSEGYSSLSVCLSAGVLALQATRRPMSVTNGL